MYSQIVRDQVEWRTDVVDPGNWTGKRAKKKSDRTMAGGGR